jgi:hypothetical protein
MAISDHRHTALLRIVQATPSSLTEAHALLLEKLRDTNIWVAVNPQRVLLSRDWQEEPGKAIISFPDDETATRVCYETGANAGADPFVAGIMSYTNAIDVANKNGALLVMVTYNGDTPHYVPISHLAKRKPCWQFW